MTLADQLREDIGMTSSSDSVPGGGWNALVRLEGYHDSGWPYSVTTALLGIQWARGSGPLPAAVELAIRDLSDYDLVGLVADVADNCPVQGVVPRYLIDRFASLALDA
jgi:hypothetical protein